MRSPVYDGLRAQAPKAGDKNGLPRGSRDGYIILHRYYALFEVIPECVLTDCAGGLLPLMPYFIFPSDVQHALFLSIGLTGVVLLAFGYVKAKLTGTGLKDAMVGAVQTLIVGGIAAGAAYGIVRAVNSSRTL